MLLFIKVIQEIRELFRECLDFKLDFILNRFYIILQGSVNIYRLDDDGPKPGPLEFDTVKEFSKLEVDPDKREELIAQTFGNYIVTLGK
jgi:hypothetical protein